MKNTHRSILANEKGFTLIEIIAVLIILGILSAVAVPKFIDLQAEAANKSAQAAIAEVKSRLSVGYGKVLLKTGSVPVNIAAICTEVGGEILPVGGNGTVPNIGDYTVTMAADDTTNIATIKVEKIHDDVVSVDDGTWTLP